MTPQLQNGPATGFNERAVGPVGDVKWGSVATKGTGFRPSAPSIPDAGAGEGQGQSDPTQSRGLASTLFPNAQDNDINPASDISAPKPTPQAPPQSAPQRPRGVYMKMKDGAEDFHPASVSDNRHTQKFLDRLALNQDPGSEMMPNKVLTADDLAGPAGSPKKAPPAAAPAAPAIATTPPAAVPAPQASAAGPVSDSLVAFVKSQEGFTPKAKGDFKQTSVGYGTRAKASNETLTEEQADSRLKEELSDHLSRVQTAAKKAGHNLTEGQLNALVSFDYNTGKGVNLLQTSKDFNQIKQRMGKYSMAGGKRMQGLVNRRQEEAKLFDSI